MSTSSDESAKKGFYAALVGILLVALCCFTPILVALLATVGLGAFTHHLDYVLFPTLAILVVVAVLSYRRWKVHLNRERPTIEGHSQGGGNTLTYRGPRW